MAGLTTDTCEVEGYTIAYSRRGRGEAVLLVHGITTYSFIWRRVIPFLKEGLEVITVDLPGCGASSKALLAAYSLNNYADYLNAFMEKLGVDRFHFVGHDIGGGIGQVFAVRYPERLIDLTLINSVAYDFWPVQPIIAMRTPILRQLAMATLDLGALRLIVKRGLYHKERLTDELLADFWEPMKTREGRKAFLHFAGSLDNAHLMVLEEALQQLEMPVLIIRGERDIYLSGAIADKLASEIPKAQLVRIETGNHFIQEDEPEQVAQALNTFFDGAADVG